MKTTKRRIRWTDTHTNIALTLNARGIPQAVIARLFDCGTMTVFYHLNVHARYHRHEYRANLLQQHAQTLNLPPERVNAAISLLPPPCP